MGAPHPLFHSPPMPSSSSDHDKTNKRPRGMSYAHAAKSGLPLQFKSTKGTCRSTVPVPRIHKVPRLPYISYNPPAVTAPPRPVSVTGPVVAHYDILSQIAAYLDDRQPYDLASCLMSSSHGFAAAAPRLYRYAKLPKYEFSMIQRRPEIGNTGACSTCYGASPPEYQHEGPDIKLVLPSIKAFKPRKSAGPLMTSAIVHDIGRHLKVATVENHLYCRTLSQICPVPSIRTLIAECTLAMGEKLCLNAPGKCFFVPKDRPYRLVLEQPCSRLMCSRHTPRPVIASNLETLLIRLPIEDPGSVRHCDEFDLLSEPAIQPKRLVFMFPSTHRQDAMDSGRYGRRDMISVDKPGGQRPDYNDNNKEYNLFYQMACLCSRFVGAGLRDCEIVVVNAEHYALRIDNLNEHDPHLQPCGVLLGLTGRDSPKESAFYGKHGHLRCTKGDGWIPPHQVDDAHEIIARRIEVIRNLLQAWISDVFKPTYAIAWRERMRGPTFKESEAKWRAGGCKGPFPDPLPTSCEPGKEEVVAAMEKLQGSIRFLSLNAYHKLEGNTDEMDDPDAYW